MAQPNLPAVTAIVVAAGASRRMGFDKLSYRLPDGRTVLETSCAALAAHPAITQLVLVCGGNRAACEAIAAACPKPCAVVQGGATRADSVRNGLAAATGELVAIHDAARPFVSESVITATLTAAAETGAAAPAVPVKDTVKVADPSGRVLDTPDRATLYAVQTPQCFRRALYTQALAAVTGEKARLVTDDCSLFELAGLPVRLTEGDYANYKITTKEDLQKEKTMRIGHGYDVHRLVEDRKLIMGGVEIPYEKGLLGHSDADVLLHAVMDAVLGAAALGDIGYGGQSCGNRLQAPRTAPAEQQTTCSWHTQQQRQRGQHTRCHGVHKLRIVVNIAPPDRTARHGGHKQAVVCRPAEHRPVVKIPP